MISISTKKNSLRILLLLVLFLVYGTAEASNGLQLSVTPTMFEMAAVPGQSWQSQVRVINSNSYPITIYAEATNFAPKGELGEGKFIPVFAEETEGKTLAEWISIDAETITIPAETTEAIPISVKVPADASPGGHFAAIMIGTKPPEDALAGTFSTSQVVTSLFFVRIAGDVREEGSIREFTVEKKFVPEPMADFVLRFENSGNVHIQPQGGIEITNIWGKKRGVIPINSQTHFGNVLPESIRKFEFGWMGEPSLLDVGRYKAVVTLAYGNDARKSESAVTYFYVVPFKSIAISLTIIAFVIWFISWCIRLYIRRLLSNSGLSVSHRELQKKPQVLFAREGDVLIGKQVSKTHPSHHTGRARWKSIADRLFVLLRNVQSGRALMTTYRTYSIAIVSFIILCGVVYMMSRSVFVAEKNYDVVIKNQDQNVSLSSEDILYNEQSLRDSGDTIQSEVTLTEVDSATSSAQLYRLHILNAGSQPGAAAALKIRLEEIKYVVDSIDSVFGDTYDRSVIVFSPGLEAEALQLSQLLDGALTSALPPEDASSEPVITVYLGDDYKF